MVDLKIKFPESFFQEEERSGYLVSAKTKEMWAIQLDLLNELDRVCRKNSIKYFLDFGSMLGAVRHKGFIPWDEDIDVSMLREDYDKLVDIGPIEFKEPYFLQNHMTDRYYDNDIARLRRSDTTFLQGDNIINRSRCNLGIFIDIFVFDSVPTNDPEKVDQIHSECEDLWYRGNILSNPPRLFHGAQLPVEILRYIYYKMRYGSSARMFKKFDEAAKRFDSSEYVSCLLYKKASCILPKKWLENTIDVPFECLTVPIPKEYDKLLTERYGDYMAPVKEDIVAMGKLCYFDTDHSYKDVVNNKDFYPNICRELSIDLHRDWGSFLSNIMDFLRVLWNKILK